MKTLLLATIALFAVSCSTPDIEEQPTYNIENNQNCGTIVSTGHDRRGDYIEVRMSYHNPSQADRYKVSNYSDYQLNHEICNFAGITKEPR